MLYHTRNSYLYRGIDMTGQHVGVGMGIFVFKDGKFLMQRRQGAHGTGAWSIPGGHIEFGESFEDTARREVKEETGLDIKNIRFGAITNDYFPEEGKHYISVWMLCDWDKGTEYITEPDKCSAQAWHTFDDVPTPLFLPWQQLYASEFFEKIKAELHVTR
jgi:8-oxo-dGTP diphosphatase